MSQLKKVAVAAAAAGALVVPLMSTPAVAETAAAENSSFTSAQESHRLAGSDRYGPSDISPFYQKPYNIFGTGEAVCGGRGCVRACMINLEKRGVLQNKFKQEFRRRPQWTVDWSDYPQSHVQDPDIKNKREVPIHNGEEYYGVKQVTSTTQQPANKDAEIDR